MEEQLIGFELAKLAKEKGYCNNNDSFYWDNGMFDEDKRKDLLYTDELTYNKQLNSRLLNATLSAPTQSLLQKWLRDKHNIHIAIEPDTLNYRHVPNEYEFTTWIDGKSDCYVDDTGFSTYEKALEQALQEALKLIKDTR